MATRTHVVTVDDLDGKEIVGEAQTITFSLGGNAYEIDLTEQNARKFQDAIAPYVAAARRVGARRGGAPEKPDLPTIRAWAREQGIKVSQRGRVGRQVQEAYRAAH